MTIAAASPRDDLEWRLNKLVDRLGSRRRIPHVVISVESGDGSFQWSQAMGDAAPAGPPMTPDTPFFIASIDKLWVAAIVFMLHEDGQLDIGDPLTAHLDPALIRRIHVRDGIDHTGSITIRHLLGHTSGLPDSLEERPADGKSLIEQLLTAGDRGWTLDEAISWARDRLTPHFAPQDPDARKPKLRYSDTNYQLLARIIEEITGDTIAAVLEAQVVRRLDLRHTHIEGGSPPAEETPHPAAVWAGSTPLHLPLAMASFPAVYSTPADSISVLRALLGGDLVGGESVAAMQQVWHRFGLPRDTVAARAPSWPIEYGLGMMRYQPPRWISPLRRVPAMIGHTGSTGSWLLFCPELDLYLAGTVDQVAAGAVPFRFLPKILDVVAQRPG